MIAHLSGLVRRAGPDFVVLDVGGVGYLVSVSATTRQKLPPPGGEYELHIHTHVREDQLALYGFASVEELEMFDMLIQVDGVGPKVGLNILGAASLEVLKRAIIGEDAAPIRRASGVGARTAAKVIIELKPRLDAVAELEVVPRAAALARRSSSTMISRMRVARTMSTRPPPHVELMRPAFTKTLLPTSSMRLPTKMPPTCSFFAKTQMSGITP